MQEKTLSDRFESNRYELHEDVEERIVTKVNECLDEFSEIKATGASSHHDADYVDFVVNEDDERERNEHIDRIYGHVFEALRNSLGLIANGVMETSLQNEEESDFRVWFVYIPEIEDAYDKVTTLDSDD